MAVLENVHHNFPLLAKQSGFNFQLHRGTVNWSEIELITEATFSLLLENLDIKEITERRNFELLEKNLVNVTNCNLGKEYDIKILDQNFIKLFKLAQLGVDYLSYCEMYLDKCVVLLQEQLIVSQEECELLKKEIQKRKEVSRNKTKNKAANYQCEKCAKVFISDVYLKFHEKRRHSNTDTPRSFDGSPKKCLCDCQKNEEIKKLSTSTQTLIPEEVTMVTLEKENTSDLKTEHLLKVEKLEQELQDLKERFKKAENTLSEKTEAFKPNAFPSINVPNPIPYNPMWMPLPPYLTHLGNGYCDINYCCQISVPEVCQSNTSAPYAENSDAINNKPISEDISDIKSESKALAEKECEVFVEEKKDSNISDIADNFKKLPEESECEKENVDLKTKTDFDKNLTKPLPPPRKLKKGFREQSGSGVATSTKMDPDTEEKTEIINNNLIVRSTPVKENLEEETNIETFEESIRNISEITKPQTNSIENLQNKRSVLSEITKQQTNSIESLQGKKSVLPEFESKSLFKRMVTRDSPSIKKLRKNFRKSLNSLCDSVSSTEKEMTKKEANFQNLRTAVVDGLNNHLKRLGISPEWSGIPRKTMKQKLSAWKHHRRLLSKENSLYPVIRQNIEENILQKLKKNFKRKKATSTLILNKQESMNLTGSEIQDILFENKPELFKNRNCLMYDTDTDSESVSSENYHEKQENNLQKPVFIEEISSSEEKINSKTDKESDILFQGGRSLNGVTEKSNQKPIIKEDKVFIDSDTESSFIENFDKSLKKCHGNELISDNYKEAEKLSSREKAKTESQSILKDGEGFQSKSTANTQKKVLFAMYSNDMEEELSDDPTDDDLWSLKSYWEKNTG